MNAAQRIGLLFLNIMMLLGLLFVRLDGQRLFAEVERISLQKRQKEYELNALMVSYHRLLAQVPSQAHAKGLKLPARMPEWLNDISTSEST